MRKTSIILSLFLLCSLTLPLTLFSQSPQAVNYQAVVRDNAGAILQNQLVSFRMNILQGSATGTNVFTETHTATTNDFGLVNLEIGNGTLVSGNFSAIDWSNGPYFIELELDENGGTNFSSLGTSQLLSVPYSLYAETAGSVAGDNDQDSTNEFQTLTQVGTDVTLSNGGGTISVADNDNDSANEIQALSLSNDTLFLSNGGFVVLPSAVDTDDQTLSISNDSLLIQDGNAVDLSPYLDNTDAQVISRSNDTIYLSNGGFAVLPTDQVDDADADPTNEIQLISLSSDTIFLSNGGFVVLPAGQVDTDDQTLSISNDTLYIQDGNSVDLSPYAVDNVNDADADPNNEIQVISLSNDTILLSNGGFVVLPPATVDTDDQTLTISNDTISIADGNSIVLPADQVNDADADPNNEIQVISISNDTILLSNGGFAVLPPATVDTDDQTLTFSNDTLYIADGNSVDLSSLEESLAIAQVASDLAAHELADNDLDASNELQTLTQAGNNVTLSNGGGTISVADDDNDPNNEIQAISFINDTLFLSNGGFVDLSNYTNTDTQTLSLSDDTLAISNGNEVLLYDHPIEMTGATPADRQIKNVSDPTDSTDVVNAQTLQWGSLIYGMATGTTDTFSVNVSPAVTLLRPGTTIMFKANHDIVGTTALDLNGLGPVPVKKNVSDDLVAGEILNGQMVQVVYDGAVWQVGAGSLSAPTGGGSGGGDGTCYTCDGF